jgi:hypothetical protein
VKPLSSPAGANRVLQPFTPAHFRLLNHVDSPLIAAGKNIVRNRANLDAYVADAQEQVGSLPEHDPGNVAYREECRIAFFILTTRFVELKKLGRLNRETLRKTALATVPTPDGEASFQKMFQSVCSHFREGVTAFGTLQQN